MKFFKQLFCKHIYKIEKREYLGTSTAVDDLFFDTTTYDTYAIYKKCINCNKTKIEKEYIQKF